MVENHNRNAIQPLTFSGLARFAYARPERVWFIAFVVAALCGGVMIWFVSRCITPQITQAISNLPPRSEIRDGSLYWPSNEVSRLAEGPWLSFVVLPQEGLNSSSTSDFEFQLAPSQLRLRSLLGYSAVDYPRGWLLLLNRDELIPRWGAWKPMVHAGVGLFTAIGLLAIWFVLALVYAPIARFIAFYADRDVTVGGLVKMNVAAMLPAALFMAVALLLYSLMDLSLPALLVAGGLHFLVQLFYVLCGPFALPKVASVPAVNPFKTKGQGGGGRAKARNPFKVAAD